MTHFSIACRRLLPTVLVIIWSVFASTSAMAANSSLPTPVAKELQEAGIPLASVGVVVQAVDARQPLLRVNAEQTMNPASVMKLITTFAALELLGPAYTWQTELRADQLPEKGRLAGNLYLKGSGDPRLALEQFWLMLRQLRERGIRDISGDLVLDHSAFLLPPHDPAAFDDEPLRPYNAGPDALMINLKSITLSLRPDGQRKSVEIVSITPSATLRVINRLTLTSDACGDWRRRFQTTVDGAAIELSGNFSVACGEKLLHLSPWPTDLQASELFRALWRELGGTLRGKVVAGSTPAEARLIAVHESPTLAEVAREINKYSNNVMARQVFLTLDPRRPATPEGASRGILDWLAERHLSMPELVLDNGSGLSRSERLSADGLARLLRAAWDSPVMPELMSSLPLAGIDGTLSKRLGNSAVAGRAHLKTGYLNGVRAIAGYVQDSNDKRWVVVFLINDANAGAGKPAMDALLRWVAEQ